MSRLRALRGRVVGPPVNTVAPSISGDPTQGQTLTGDVGSWTNSPTSFALRWLRDAVAIDGAIGYTFDLTGVDVGTEIVFEAAAINSAAPSGVVATSAAVGPIADSSPDLPATRTVAFGSKTRRGHGGDPLGYTGAGYLGITGGNTGSVWTIDNRNHLVPAGTYGAAPPTFSGPYTLTITEYSDSGKTTATGASQTTTVNMLANAAHVREMTTTVGGVNQDATNRSQLRSLLLLATGVSGAVVLGDTIWCRDGHLNPNAIDMDFRIPAGGWAAGSGSRITVRSETVDATTDANGHASGQHGFKIGALKASSTLSGDVEVPIDWRDIHFYTNVAGSARPLLGFATVSYGMRTYNCRIEIGPAVTNPNSVAGFQFNSQAIVEDCYFKGMSKAITHLGASQVRRCVGENLLEDFTQGGPLGDNVYEDNFIFNPRFESGGHGDNFQHTGAPDGTTIQGGSIVRNISMRNDGPATAVTVQGAFLSQPQGETGIVENQVVRNNLFHNDMTNQIYMTRYNSPLVGENTCLTDFQAGSSGNAAAILTETGFGGTDGTWRNNVSNTINIASQGGTVVNSNNGTLDRDLTEYTTAFPNYTNTGLVNRAAALLAFTPADLAVASGGMKNTDGTFRGALFPATAGETIGAWNDNSVFEPENPTWVAAHPPAT